MFSREKLYEELLFESLYRLGTDEIKPELTDLYEFLQKAFNFREDIHDILLEKVKARETPTVYLNVKVVEAKDLHPSDSNGLADPYVKLYVASSPDVKYKTSVKIETLNPCFNERFAIPLEGVPNDETLMVEVWDFDKEEDIKGKLTKIKKARSAKGIRKLFKEIVTTKPSKKDAKEFIGGTKIPIYSIPTIGLIDNYTLNKRKKKKAQGSLRLRFHFSSEKKIELGNQEHRELLKTILNYEIDLYDFVPFSWKGQFSKIAISLLIQHRAYSGLTEIGVSFAQWAAYSEITRNHPLSFELFEYLLDVLSEPVKNKNNEQDDELVLFWESTRNMLPSCFGVIKKLRKKLSGGINPTRSLKIVLSLMKKIEALNPPTGFNLFSRKIYSWIKKNDDSTPLSFHNVITQAVTFGAEKFFKDMIDQDELVSGDNGIILQELIDDVQSVTADMTKAIEQHDRIFQDMVNFKYAETIFKIYDVRVTELVKPLIEEIFSAKRKAAQEAEEAAQEEANNLKAASRKVSAASRKVSVAARQENLVRQDSIVRQDSTDSKAEEINMLSVLFQLYLLLKSFSALGSKIFPEDTDYLTKHFYDWFSNGVEYWLDISLYKAWTRIERAIELDPMSPVDSTVNYSTSAVDTIAIFHSIRIFWQQLNWPVGDSAILMLKRMLNDVCRCCVFFGDKTAEKVARMDAQRGVKGNNYVVTKEWCLAINNIDYVRKSIRSVAMELGFNEIAKNEADSLEIMASIEKAEQAEMEKILELFGKLAKNMHPLLKEFLYKGAENVGFMERTLLYMDQCLGTMNKSLSPENFTKVLAVIWTEISFVFRDIVDENVEESQPPSFYSNLSKALKIMRESFKCETKDEQIETILERVERMLEIHGSATVELIHQYYKERYYMQSRVVEAKHGTLTVQCHFEGNIIVINILSATNLVPMDSNGLCDPFVKIFFFPEGKFTNSSQMKTKVHKKTLFPLFDEKFSIRLSDEQRNMSDAIILFSVMDEDLFGMSHDFAADAYVMFKDIHDISDGPPKHQQLKLTRPSNEDKMESVKALRSRDRDKVASNFLKIIKAKIDDAK